MVSLKKVEKLFTGVLVGTILAGTGGCASTLQPGQAETSPTPTTTPTKEPLPSLESTEIIARATENMPTPTNSSVPTEKPTKEAPKPTATKDAVVYNFELGKQLPATVEEVGVVGLQAPDPVDNPVEFAEFKVGRDAWAKTPGNCDSAIYHKTNSSGGIDNEGVMGYLPVGYEKGNSYYHDTAACGYWFEHGGKNYQVITIPFDWGDIYYTDIVLQDGPTRTLVEQLAWIWDEKVGMVYFVRHSGGYTSRTDISFDEVWRQLAIKFADDFDVIDPHGQGDPNSPDIPIFGGYVNGY